MGGFLNEVNKLAFLLAPVFYKLVSMSVTALAIGAVLLLLRRLLDKKITPFWKYLCWLPMILALVVPYRPESALSLLKNTSQIEEISFRTAYDSARLAQKIEIEPESAPIVPEEVTPQELGQEVDTLFLKSLTFDVALPLLWVAGVAVSGVFLVFAQLQLRRRLNRHQIPNASSHERLLAECREALGVKRKVCLLTQRTLSAPAILGVFRPVILLPEYVGEMSEEEVRYILLHELAHQKRLDTFTNMLLLGVQAVYWFNPLLLLCFRRLREDMELANDGFVLNRLGTSHEKGYSRSLLTVAERCSGISLVPKLLCMADGGEQMKRRILMVKLRTGFQKHRFLIGGFCVVLLIAVTIFFLTKPPEKIEEVPLVGTTVSEETSGASETAMTELDSEMERIQGLLEDAKKSLEKTKNKLMTSDLEKDYWEALELEKKMKMELEAYQRRGGADYSSSSRYFPSLSVFGKGGKSDPALATMILGEHRWSDNGVAMLKKRISYHEMEFDNNAIVRVQLYESNPSYFLLDTTEEVTQNKIRGVDSMVVYDVSTQKETSLKYFVSEDGSIYMEAPDKAGTYYYGVNLSFENGTASYGVQVVARDKPKSLEDDYPNMITFWNSDHSSLTLGEPAARAMLDYYQSTSIPGSARISEYTIEDINTTLVEPKEGEAFFGLPYQYVVEVTYSIKTASDAYHSAVDGHTGKGTFSGIRRTLLLSRMDIGNLYTIVGIKAGDEIVELPVIQAAN